ncbi:MAG: putative ABC transporter ATP-binding protein [Candidatus Anoxychlamydiales bacterium]|nr:putative ABC transporter ATP-binding protein [Candidatus Anoxychlamydiales bacterium]
MLTQNDFKKIGKEVFLEQQNLKIDLSSIKKIYYVEEGSVDIFFEEKKDKTFIRKTFLASIEKDNIFFSFENLTSDLKIFAAVSDNSKIFEISIEDILKNLNSEEFLNSFSNKINSWIVNIYENLIIIFKEEIDTFLFFDKPTKLYSKDQKDIMIDFFLKDKTQIRWIEIKKGSMNFLNEKKMIVKENQIFPMSYKTFFSFKDEILVDVLDTKNVIKNKNFENILNFFHKIILDYLFKQMLIKNKNEKNRIFEKKDLEKHLINKTLVSFFNIFEKKPIEIPIETKDKLFNALKVVGDSLKIHFEISKKIYEKEINNIIYEICENSNVRYRKVTLKNTWYKKESSNFLGFLKEGKKPVAIIKNKKHYEIIDPDIKSKIKITKTTKDLLENETYEFYETFGYENLNGKKILKFCLKNQSKEVFNFIFYSLISIMLAFYIPFANSKIFNIIIPHFEKGLLYQVAFGLFIAAISSALFSFTSSFVILRIQSKIRIRFQVGLFDRFLRLPISFFKNFTKGDLLKRLFEMFEVQRILSSGFISSLFMGIFSFLYFIQMFFYSWQLALINLAFLTVYLFIFIFILKIKIKIDTDVLNEQSKLNGFILQILSGIEKIRLSSSEKILFEKWGSRFSKIRSKTLSSDYLASFLSSINAVFLTLGTFFIFAFAIFLLKTNKFNLGNFIAFNAAFAAFATAMNSLFVTLISYIGMIIPRWKRSKIILTYPLERKKEVLDPGIIKGFLDVENVSFRYEENLPLVLKNVSIKASPGELIAIVGPTNCGKSTLIRLLLNYYKPNSGSIFVDGKNLNDLDITKVRKQLGVVLQGSEVFSGTLEENLIFSKIVPSQEIERVMKITKFDETLKCFPMGLQTYLTDNGKNLSGGQKQQLVLTRALISKPNILILDEATSFFDNSLQKEISENIDKLRITRIVIAHRLDTIKNADRIYLMINGEIVDFGNFDTLYKKNSFFKNLVDMQSL